MEYVYTSICPGDNNCQKIIIFTEGKGNNYFSRFKKNDIPASQSPYKFENIQEGGSLLLTKNNRPCCYILPGRQIVTKEKLEVLSIASKQNIEDELPIEEVIKKLLDKKEIAVLAWGVGKWFFKRGKFIKDIIEKYHSPYLFLGDNSARPVFWPVPKLYHLARKYNIQILRGSDPLPFIEEARRVGSFGFLVEGDFQADKPAESFRDILIASKSSIVYFGHQDSVFLFLKRQTKSRFL